MADDSGGKIMLAAVGGALFFWGSVFLICYALSQCSTPWNLMPG